MSQVVSRMSELLEGRIGLRLTPGARARAEEVLRTRALTTGVGTINRYLDELEAGRRDEELQLLINLFTVGVTRCFRHPASFKAIVDEIVPLLHDFKRGKVINIWTAACSTGQETYSIAMALADAGWFDRQSFHIVGSDVNTDSVALARNGRWRLTTHEANSFKPSRHLEREGTTVTVSDELRKRVRFAEANLVSGTLPQPPLGTGGWDVVVCANVLYYFSSTTVQSVLGRVHKSMGERGALFLGGEELLPEGTSLEMRVVRAGDAFAYVTGDWGGRLKTSTVLPARTPVATGPMNFNTDALEAYAAHYQEQPATPAPVGIPVPNAEPAAAKPEPTPFGAVKDGWEVEDIRRLASRGAVLEALDAADKLVAERPDMPEAVAGRAYLMFRARKLDEAIEAFTDAISLDPLAPELHFFLGFLCNKLERFDEAIGALSAALFIAPDFMFARYQLALAHHALEHFADAAKEYDAATRARDRGGMLERLRAQAQLSGESFWLGEEGMEKLVQAHREAALQRQPPPGLVGTSDRPQQNRDTEAKPRGRAQ